MRFFPSAPAAVLGILAAGLVTLYAAEQRYLTGELSGTYPEGEYTVSGNVHVLPRTTLTFSAGSTIRFENFTGIIVRGELVCKGAREKPILFTSVRAADAESFDWNGIKVAPDAAGITLENCTISFSSFGLNIESNATPVSLSNVVFIGNGSASLTREKKMLPIKDTAAVSFTWPDVEGRPPVGIGGKGGSGGKGGHVTPVVARRPSWLGPVRIGTAGTTIVGGVLGLTGSLMAQNYEKKLREYGADEKYKKPYDNAALMNYIGLGVCAFGAAGFTVTFLF
jgi:hypothetical protein